MLNHSDSQFAATVALILAITMTAAGFAFAKATQTRERTCSVVVAKTSHESHVWLRPCREVQE